MLITKFKTFIYLLTYCFLFLITYVFIFNRDWEYMGYSFHEPSFYSVLLGLVFSILPGVLININNKKPSFVLFVIIYLFTYIPIVLGMFMSSLDSSIFNILEYVIFLFFGIFIIGLNYFSLNYPILNISFRAPFWFFFYFIFFIMFFHVFFVFGSSFKFISPFSEEIYILREQSSYTTDDSFVGYSILILSGSILPFLLSLGLRDKVISFLIISILGQFILYMTAANKAFIFSLFFLFFIYFILQKKNNLLISSLVIGILILVISILLSFFSQFSDNEFSKLFVGIFTIRFVGISSLNSILYFDFFNNNPFTYYSHIGLFRGFLNYPYGELELGQVIGMEYFDSVLANYNATFLITDGYAALGNMGIIIICIIVSISFFLFDLLLSKKDYFLCVMSLSYSGINLMNVSFFTSLLSGGLFLTLILLMLYSDKKSRYA